MDTAYRTCPFCEATCGLEVTVSDGVVERVRGDADDVFSHGFLCPKGVSLKELHEDPDRLRTPMRRTPAGDFEPVSWDEAFDEIERRLVPIMEEHGRDAVGAYIGNPAAHGLSPLLYGRVLFKALGSKNIFSASTVDQFPKQMASALMFGTGLSVPVPDLDRTDFLLVLGANPLASNGSLMTAPDVRGRLKAIRARGGKVVVVDPRRTRTAQEADEHLFIRPGTDALLLFALANVLVEEGLEQPGPLADLVNGLDEVRALAAGFPPESVAAATGIEADRIRALARELAAAPTAAVYGRIGTTTQAFGTTASWLVDVINVLTGNLDRPGGAMWSRPAAGSSNTRGEPGRGRGARFGRWTSRVRGAGEIFGELPVACLAEEIETPGEGQIRALLTLAGNPAVSTPNAGRLDAALDSLELMVSIDIYINETTRHADLILPAPSPLEKSHYDLALYALAIRNVANYSPPVFERTDDQLEEWEILLRLTGIATGQGANADVAAIDDFVAHEAVRREVADEHSPLHGRDVGEVMAELAPRVGPERLLDLLLRSGPYGLTLADLEAAPARHRPGAARAAAAGGAAHARRPHRPGARGCHRRRRPVARGAEPAAAGPRAHRTPAPAVQQLVDAQPPAAGARAGAVHIAGESRRRGAPRAPGRQRRLCHRAGRRGRGDGRGHGRRDAGRRKPAARLGARRRGSGDERRPRARGNELQRADR